jgi:hypothetical protein
MITTEEIKKVSIATLSRTAPIGRCFNDEEAKHLMRLISRKAASELVFEHTTSPGCDGENFTLIGIRRKDRSVPRQRKFRYVYEAWVYLGFLNRRPLEVMFLEALAEAGAETDTFTRGAIEANKSYPLLVVEDLLIGRRAK